MVNYSRLFKQSLSFSLEPKRWGPAFLVYLTFFFLIAAVGMASAPTLLDLMATGQLGLLNLAPLAGFMGAVVFLIVMSFFATQWVFGSLVYQSWKPKAGLEKAFSESGKKLHSLILAEVAMSAIISACMVIPMFLTVFVSFWAFPLVIIGFIAAVYFLLALFLNPPFIVLGNKGYSKALMGSYKLFRKRPLDTIICFIIVLVATILIGYIFSLPSSIIHGKILSAIGGPGIFALYALVFSGLKNMAWLLFGQVIAAIGSAIALAFSAKLITGFYLETSKGLLARILRR